MKEDNQRDDWITGEYDDKIIRCLQPQVRIVTLPLPSVLDLELKLIDTEETGQQ